MSYFIKLPSEHPAFPVTCPFCNANGTIGSRKVRKKVHHSVENEGNGIDEREFLLPMCDNCKVKGWLFAFLSWVSIIFFFVTLTAALIYKPMRDQGFSFNLQILGVFLIITVAFKLLRHLHVNHFKTIDIQVLQIYYRG